MPISVSLFHPSRGFRALLCSTLLVLPGIAVLGACSGGGGTAPVAAPAPLPPPEPAPAADPAPLPAEHIDLSHWRLTIPADANGTTTGKAVSISPAALSASPPYESEWFYIADDGALTFWVPVNGTYVGGSTYPRSELREMLDPGDASVNWYSWQDSELVAICAVQQTPSLSGRVTIGQVHAYDASLPLLMLQYVYASATQTGSLEAIINPTPNATPSQRLRKVLVSGIALGARLEYHLAVRAGVLRVEVNGVSLDYTLGTAWSGFGHYFKAGAYIPEKGSSGTDGARVAFYKLLATHR